MANTITNTTVLNGSAKKVVYLSLVSDGTEETDYVLYDSSALNSTDPTDSTILKIEGCVNILDATAVDVRINLEFDATTDVLALSLPINQPFCFDFTEFGGLANTSGSGKTGDITLTSTGLETGDTAWLVLTVRPN